MTKNIGNFKILPWTCCNTLIIGILNIMKTFLTVWSTVFIYPSRCAVSYSNRRHITGSGVKELDIPQIIQPGFIDGMSEETIKRYGPDKKLILSSEKRKVI